MRHFELISLERIQETEEHDAAAAARLADAILELGFWTVPIVIECSSLAIMDGHHRLNVAKLLEFARVPCLRMDYHKGGVVLTSWRSDWRIEVADVFSMINANKKFPCKTTRHLFYPPIKEISVPLSLLY